LARTLFKLLRGKGQMLGGLCRERVGKERVKRIGAATWAGGGEGGKKKKKKTTSLFAKKTIWLYSYRRKVGK